MVYKLTGFDGKIFWVSFYIKIVFFEYSEKFYEDTLNPCATKVLAPLLYEFLGEQEIRIRDYFTASSVYFICNKDLIIFFNIHTSFLLFLKLV
jgi:hypothetical protein